MSTTCNVCFKVFATKNQMKGHMKDTDHGLEPRKRDVACPLCRVKKFKSSSGAVAHVESGSCTNCQGKDKASFTKNSTKHMHGIVTLVASYLRPNTVKVAEGREGDKYLVTRYDHIHPALNIINYYGEQEKGDEEKGKKEKIMESWRRLLEDIKDIENTQRNDYTKTNL